MRHCSHLFIALSFLIFCDIAHANDWASVDVRGVKTGMNFPEAEMAAKVSMPGGNITTGRQSVVFHNERFEYGSHIGSNYSDNRTREKLHIQMVPPNSIRKGFNASVVTAINFRKDFFRNDGFLLDDFKKELVSKYGEPVTPFYTGMRTAVWTYTREGKRLSNAFAASASLEIKKKCDALRRESDDARKNSDSKYQKIYNQFITCKQKENLPRGCLRKANKFCPYILTVSWRTFGGSGSHIRSYDLRLFNLDLSRLKNDRIQKLREELEAQFKTKLTPSGDIKL